MERQGRTAEQWRWLSFYDKCIKSLYIRRRLVRTYLVTLKVAIKWCVEDLVATKVWSWLGRIPVERRQILDPSSTRSSAATIASPGLLLTSIEVYRTRWGEVRSASVGPRATETLPTPARTCYNWESTVPKHPALVRRGSRTQYGSRCIQH